MYSKYRIPYTGFYLMRWIPKAKTDIHFHPNVDCHFIVLSGNFKELIFQETKSSGYIMKHSKNLNRFQTSSINDKIGPHKMINMDEKVNWTLHLYK